MRLIFDNTTPMFCIENSKKKNKKKTSKGYADNIPTMQFRTNFPKTLCQILMRHN